MNPTLPVIPPIDPRSAAAEHTDEIYEAAKASTSVPAKRTFDTGATRDTEIGKLDYEGFMSPLVMKRYAEYLNGHRTMSDGSTRDSDNWQKGIPFDVYMKSAWRHFFSWWEIHRGWRPGSTLHARMEDSLCAILFNVSGYLHEWLASKTIGSKLAEKAFGQADLASQESEGLSWTDHYPEN